MKTYTTYNDIPAHAVYLGSEDGSGCMSETLNDIIGEAMQPARLHEDDGTYSYFDLAREVSA
jgi:hypothetical protein